MTGALISLLLVVLFVLMYREARIAQQLREAEEGLQDKIAAQTSALSEEIEERKSIEGALQQSEARFMDFAKTSSDWFWEMDENCRFSYFSDRFEEITGVPQEVLLGKTREETGVPDVDRAQWETHLANLAARKSFRGFAHPRTLSDGRADHQQ
jgi:PAS domain S-box-containing protein